VAVMADGVVGKLDIANSGLFFTPYCDKPFAWLATEFWMWVWLESGTCSETKLMEIA